LKMRRKGQLAGLSDRLNFEDVTLGLSGKLEKQKKSGSLHFTICRAATFFVSPYAP